MEVIRTARMDIVPVTAAIIRADASKRADLPALLGARVPAEWPPALLADHLEEFARNLEADVERQQQHPFYWLLRDEAPQRADADGRPSGGIRDVRRVLIGNGGFFDFGGGTWMIGYSVLEAYHNRGYATEAVAALLAYAFTHPAVTTVIGTTFPNLIASIRVMEKNGFRYDGAGDEAGTIRYVLNRPAGGAGL